PRRSASWCRRPSSDSRTRTSTSRFRSELLPRRPRRPTSTSSSSARTGSCTRPSGPAATACAGRGLRILPAAARDDAEAAADALAPQWLHAGLEQLAVGTAAQAGLEGGHGLVLAPDRVQDRRLLVVQILEQPVVVGAGMTEGTLDRLERLRIALHVG